MLKFVEEILATLRMQVGGLGEGDALTHLDVDLGLLMIVLVWKFGVGGEKEKSAKTGQLEDFLIRQRAAAARRAHTRG